MEVEEVRRLQEVGEVPELEEEGVLHLQEEVVALRGETSALEGERFLTLLRVAPAARPMEVEVCVRVVWGGREVGRRC